MKHNDLAIYEEMDSAWANNWTLHDLSAHDMMQRLKAKIQLKGKAVVGPLTVSNQVNR